MEFKKRLCQEVEQALGRALRTPKDFDYLRECIFQRLHVQVSATTLKRVWGYLLEGVQPREGTLDILARFIGFLSYGRFVQSVGQGGKGQLQSAPVLSRSLVVQEELHLGDRLRLTWRPNRICDVRYEGDSRFTVEYAQNTRLRPGNTFCCALLIEGEPLYLNNLRQGENPPVAYVCGKQEGIRFERKG